MNGLWRVFRGLLAFGVELELRLGSLIDERLSRQLRFPVRQLIPMHLVCEHTIRPAPAEKYGLRVNAVLNWRCQTYLSAIIRDMKLSSPVPVGKLADSSTSPPFVGCGLDEMSPCADDPSLLDPPAALGLGLNIMV